MTSLPELSEPYGASDVSLQELQGRLSLPFTRLWSGRVLSMLD